MPTPLHGPAFGSYPAADVTWLLKDLSDVTLEAPVEEREQAIQAGRAHYAESLPVEYQPSEEYYALFDKALAEQARRVALAAATLVHLVVELRGPDVALASLARAGTPIGILLRRYAARLGLDLPHYTMSIVRGRGLDAVALRHLAERHDPADVVFVDGWTGKGAISRELTAACAEMDERLGLRFDPSLAVLADPGSSTDVYGTRDDFLIPSACLNSTVSGLVSRTVLNDTLIGPDDFHGAKFYAELAPADVSMRYVETVEEHFDGATGVGAEARAEAARLLSGDRTPTWSGWAAVEEVSTAYGIGDVNLVKPGVGETTRVLLRRVPWRVLVRPDARRELGHVELLAEQRGVAVEEVEGLAFSCMGLIHPRFGQGGAQ
jgi:hypothetical protein